MRRAKIIVAAICATLLIGSIDGAAQEKGKTWKVGFLTSGAAVAFKSRLTAFKDGMRHLGYEEGRNLVIEARYADGRLKQLPRLAMELARLKIDIFLTHGGVASRAADAAGRKVGRKIPVVFGQQADPVGDGVVSSLAQPGGNITGVSDYHGLLVPKKLAILKEALPAASRVAVIHSVRHAKGRKGQLALLEAVAPGLGMKLIPVLIRNPGDFESAFAKIRKANVDAINVLGYQKGPGFGKRFIAFAQANRLPSILTNPRHVVRGALMSYGADTRAMYRRAATFVDKILKGTKPAELPVEQPTKFYLTVNLKTAKALGINIPKSILLRADEVIE